MRILQHLPLLVAALAAPTAAMAASADNEFWLGCVTGAVIAALVLFVGWFLVGLVKPARSAEYAWEDGRVR